MPSGTMALFTSAERQFIMSKKWHLINKRYRAKMARIHTTNKASWWAGPVFSQLDQLDTRA
jgi:hypothetical protein